MNQSLSQKTSVFLLACSAPVAWCLDEPYCQCGGEVADTPRGTLLSAARFVTWKFFVSVFMWVSDSHGVVCLLKN